MLFGQALGYNYIVFRKDDTYALVYGDHVISTHTSMSMLEYDAIEHYNRLQLHRRLFTNKPQRYLKTWVANRKRGK